LSTIEKKNRKPILTKHINRTEFLDQGDIYFSQTTVNKSNFSFKKSE